MSVADALTLCSSLSSLSHVAYLIEYVGFFRGSAIYKINKSLAANNKALLDQILKLVADSADNVKRASVEAANEQLQEIKKLRREELKSFKRKGNELQYKFNVKLQDSFEDAKPHLEITAIDKAKETLAEGMSLLAERQKLILLVEWSDFGWKTVDEYVEHELAVDEEDGEKIHCAEERAEKGVKSTVARKSARLAISSCSSVVQSAPFGSPRFTGPFQAVDFASPRNQWFPVSQCSFETPARPDNCFACGKFGHWRSECVKGARGSKGN